ncbi:MAG TPA: oligoendopeptidase F [Pseudogracilibacillus sp.]|nr:oligoendopeptidase F [Pseudogracilibacillus sp.]
MKNMPKRSEVKREETWNLKDLFETEAAYERAIEDLKVLVNTFEKKYQGNLTDASSVIKMMTDYEIIIEKIVPLGNYSNLSLSVDQTNEKAQTRASHFGQTAAKISSQLSFVNSELLALPADVLLEAMKMNKEYKGYLEKLIKKQPYQLSPETEKVLAAFSAVFNGPYELYELTKMVDIDFPNFKVGNQEYPLSYVSFEGDWESEVDTKKRHAAFATFTKTLRNYQHTTAKTYDMHLQQEKTESDLRGYKNIFESLLFDQEVDRSMYDRQIDLITTELAPHMRKYAKLLQKVHGLEKMTFADLKIPLDPNYEPKVTIEGSKEYIEASLKVMGEEYLEMVEQSYSKRWIDFAQNKGKSTGAFCASPFGSHSYILISWTGSMEDVFVLAHELGHAGHFKYTNAEQNIFNTDTSMYFIEAPSTMNEMLVANHLLNHSKDPKFKRWVISSIVSRTYYHNFVTHLLEAAYQREVYNIIDAGGSVNATILNEIKREVLEDFWGDDVEINDGAELTWMRQPHYYMGLYPYTYSAGLTISTAMSQRILNEGKSAVKDWKEVLKAGGTKTPKELALMAGIDISTDKPLKETIAYIGSLIDELIELTKEIEGI